MNATASRNHETDPACAFVIHLTSRAEDGDDAVGRVEHIKSGRAGRFESWSELARFMRAAIAEFQAGRG